jgi:hypothetical protein
MSVPTGWTRTAQLPQGFDAGFRKGLGEGQEATLFLHHEVMPPEVGEPPSDTSDMQRQWDSMVRNQHSDVTSLRVAVPKVQGRVLINSAYKLTDSGATVQRRYTYFLADRTAFVVQCSAPPAQWTTVQGDFDKMLASLEPGAATVEKKSVTDAAAIEKVRKGVPILLGSWPAAWECSTKAVNISSGAQGRKRSLEITLAFKRSDIGRVYGASKLLFEMLKAGKSDEELNKLPNPVKEAAASSGPFIKYIGQVWGYAYGEVLRCNPPIERYRTIVADSAGRQVGSVSVSKEDASAILTGKVTASDGARLARLYVFDEVAQEQKRKEVRPDADGHSPIGSAAVAPTLSRLIWGAVTVAVLALAIGAVMRHRRRAQQ